MIIKEVTNMMKKLSDSEFEGIISFFNIKKEQIKDIINEVNKYLEETLYYTELENKKIEIKNKKEILEIYKKYRNKINIISIISIILFILYILVFIPDYGINVKFDINYNMFKYSFIFITPAIICIIIRTIIFSKINDVKMNLQKLKKDLEELREYICYLKNSLILLKINEKFKLYILKESFSSIKISEFGKEVPIL